MQPDKHMGAVSTCATRYVARGWAEFRIDLGLSSTFRSATIVEIRESRVRYLWWIIGLLALGGVAWLTPYVQDWQVRNECRGWYAEAKTAPDSALVDDRVSVFTKGQAVNPTSCGLLRRAARL